MIGEEIIHGEGVSSFGEHEASKGLAEMKSGEGEES